MKLVENTAAGFKTNWGVAITTFSINMIIDIIDIGRKYLKESLMQSQAALFAPAVDTEDTTIDMQESPTR